MVSKRKREAVIAEEWGDAVKSDYGLMEHRQYVLAELRLARLRAQTLVAEIETIGVALKAEMISPQMAMVWMAEANALAFLSEQEEIDEPDGVASVLIAGIM